jgi:hypothetical protein
VHSACNNVAQSIAVYGVMCNQQAICEISGLIHGVVGILGGIAMLMCHLWLGLCLDGFVQSGQTNNHVLSMGYLPSSRHNKHQTLHNRKKIASICMIRNNCSLH